MTSHVVRSLSIGGLELRRIVYDERMRIPRHVHTTAGFCLVLDGEYDERYATRTLDCARRTVTFSPAGEEHANEFGAARADCFTIELGAEWLRRYEGAVPRLDQPFLVRGGSLEWLAGKLYAEFRASDESTPIVIEGLVLEMIGEASRARRREREPRASQAIREARELIRARFHEPLSLSDVASAVGRNAVYVATEFRRAYGETVGDCIRRERVSEAARLLGGSDLPLADVAYACGFATQSHFTRTFREATGTTPAQYRRQLSS